MTEAARSSTLLIVLMLGCALLATLSLDRIQDAHYGLLQVPVFATSLVLGAYCAIKGLRRGLFVKCASIVVAIWLTIDFALAYLAWSR